MIDPVTRYHDHLVAQGVADPGVDVREHGGLAVDGLRFFSRTTPDGARSRAAASPTGLLVWNQGSGPWRELLAGADAAIVAERIGWLAGDDRLDPYAPRPLVALVKPGDPPPRVTIDPRQWALIATPKLDRNADGTLAFEAWYLERDRAVRWSVVAPPQGPARITTTAADVLAPTEADPVPRATAALRASQRDERLWGLATLAASKARSAAPAVAAVLADDDVAIREQAALALAAFADPSTVPALARALAAEPAPLMRSVLAAALGQIADAPAIRALTDALATEAQPSVRLELVHAIAKGGPAARTALANIAAHGATPDVRQLAKSYVAATTPAPR